MPIVRGLGSGPIAVVAGSPMMDTEEERGLGFTLQCQGLTLKEFYSLQNSLDDLSDRTPRRRNPSPVIFEPDTLHGIFVHVVDVSLKAAVTVIATKVMQCHLRQAQEVDAHRLCKKSHEALDDCGEAESQQKGEDGAKS